MARVLPPAVAAAQGSWYLCRLASPHSPDCPSMIDVRTPTIRGERFLMQEVDFSSGSQKMLDRDFYREGAVREIEIDEVCCG